MCPLQQWQPPAGLVISSLCCNAILARGFLEPRPADKTWLHPPFLTDALTNARTPLCKRAALHTPEGFSAVMVRWSLFPVEKSLHTNHHRDPSCVRSTCRGLNATPLTWLDICTKNNRGWRQPNTWSYVILCERRLCDMMVMCIVCYYYSLHCHLLLAAPVPAYDLVPFSLRVPCVNPSVMPLLFFTPYLTVVN